MARGSGNYTTTLDRGILALGAGVFGVSLTTLLLVVAGGQRDPLMMAGALAIGAIFGVIGIVAIAGPIWLILHIAGRRGPVEAALTVGGVALVLLAAGWNWGGASFERGTGASPLLGTTASAMLALFATGAIGWMMQRIAYRRVMGSADRRAG